MKSTAAILKAFAGKKILVVGDVMLDHYLFGNVDRISPEAPVPVVKVMKEENRLGGAANVALNLKALGGEVWIAGVVGNDDSGKKLIELLNENGINTEAIVTSKIRVTTVKSRIISKQHQMLRFDHETTGYLNYDDSFILRRKIESISYHRIDGVVLEDYNKGTLNKKNIPELLKLFASKNIPVAVDPKQENFLLYKGVQLFKPNLREIEEAIGKRIPLDEIMFLENASEWLRKKLNHQNTVITLGAAGIFLDNNKTSVIKSAHPRKVSDVSGAGDTVIAVLALAMAAGISLSEVIDLANTAGGLVCEQSGVVPITKEMLLN